MSPRRGIAVLCVFISLAPLLTLNAQNCTPEFYVRSNTVYEACVGDHLQIECPVIVCREQDLQTITWYTSPNNRDFGPVTKSTSTDSGWNHFGLLNGTTFLIFRNIQTTNSGFYQCQTGFSRSHKISVIVHGLAGFTRRFHPQRTTADPLALFVDLKHSTSAQDTWLPYVYRALAMVLFFIIVTTMHAMTTPGRTGCARRLRKGPDLHRDPPSRRGPQEPSDHIYENDLQIVPQ
ncbi:uncharacterized protein btla isoform 3-T9 [Aulostomus maculatus]